MPSRDEKEGRGPVSAVRVKRGVWERVKARMMEKFPRGAKKPASGESGERGWDYETSPQEKGKGQGKGRLRRVWRALRGKGAGKGKGE